MKFGYYVFCNPRRTCACAYVCVCTVNARSEPWPAFKQRMWILVRKAFRDVKNIFVNSVKFWTRSVCVCTLFHIWQKSVRLTWLGLIPWSRGLPEKLRGPRLVRKFTAFCGTGRFITTFTWAHHLSLSWARSVQSRGWDMRHASGSEKFVRGLPEILKRRDHFGDIQIERKVILKWIIFREASGSGVRNHAGPSCDSIMLPLREIISKVTHNSRNRDTEYCLLSEELNHIRKTYN
jgi:hypothetical protein